MSTIDDILRAANYLTAIRLDNHGCSEVHAAKPTLQLALAAFRRNVGSNLASNEFRQKTSRFLSLVFLAACCMAIYQGYQVESVDAAQKGFLKASRRRYNEGPKSLAKDHTAVRWLIAEI